MSNDYGYCEKCKKEKEYTWVEYGPKNIKAQCVFCRTVIKTAPQDVQNPDWNMVDMATFTNEEAEALKGQSDLAKSNVQKNDGSATDFGRKVRKRKVNPWK